MKGLENLSKYRYNAIDCSIFCNLLQPYYRFILYFIPMWMAPNLVTLVGLFFVIAAFLMVTFYQLILHTPLPSWACVLCAALVWWYSTMDNIDGKQARRTGTSSPLGELFDHGCDALATFMGTWIQISTMNLGCTKQALFLLLVGFAAFFVSTAEHFHTKTLYLGYISGPTEGIIIACLVMLASGYWGVDLWTSVKLGNNQFLSSIISFPFISNLALSQAIIYGCTFLLVFFIVPFCIRNVLQSPNTKATIPQMILEGIPFFIFLLVVHQWPLLSNSAIYSGNGLNFFAFILCAGLIFCRWMPTIVLCNFLHQPFPYVIPTVIPFISFYALIRFVPSISALYNPTNELILFISMAVFLMCNYLYWARFVIRALCSSLNIHCFTIPKVPAKEKTDRKLKN